MASDVERLEGMLAAARSERDAALDDAAVLVELLSDAWWVRAAAALERLRTRVDFAERQGADT